MTVLGFLGLPLLGIIVSAADDFQAAGQLYDAGQFAEAVAIYERIEPKTAYVWFNLGNAWFRQEQYGRAILNYERARRIAPRDPDILANLRFAEDRLAVTEVNRPAQPARRFWRSVTESRTLREWCLYELMGFWLMFVAAGLAGWRPSWRTASITAAAALLVGWAVAAAALGARLTAAPGAVVLTTRTEARFAPQPEATVHFALTEGMQITVREDRGQWLFIERADGQQGWVRAEAVERI